MCNHQTGGLSLGTGRVEDAISHGLNGTGADGEAILQDRTFAAEASHLYDNSYAYFAGVLQNVSSSAEAVVYAALQATMPREEHTLCGEQGASTQVGGPPPPS